MATPTNHWKLGLFIVVGTAAAVATPIFLGARTLQQETVQYVTFFNESVQGLEVGSPVKFRGVILGHVSDIDVASDHRHVAVTCELGVDELDTLGLNVPRGEKANIRVPPDLRMQLGSSGITGVKFILIDFFPVADNPVPRLPFAVPENTIPAASSTMKNLEDAVVKAVNRIPEVAEELLKVLARIDTILADIDEKNVPEALIATMGKVNQVLADVQGTLRDLDAPELSRAARQALDQMAKLIERIQGDKGLLAGAERTSTALGDVSRNATGLGLELEETMREVQQAAATIQRLGDALDRDGDMLLKGRSKRK